MELTKSQEERAAELHEKALIILGHTNVLTSHVTDARSRENKRAIIKDTYLPIFRQGNICTIFENIAGDVPYLFPLTTINLYPLKRTLLTIDYTYSEIEESDGQIVLIKSAEDVLDAHRRDQLGILLKLEGPIPLEDDLGLLRVLYRLGLRSINLAWKNANQVIDGHAEKRNGGLSNFGSDVIREMNRLGIIIDASYVSDAGYQDVLEVTRDPIIMSHGNAKSVHNNFRNLTDEMLKALAENGGVVGLHALSSAIKQSKSGEKITILDWMEHFDFIESLVGVDHIGLGPDVLEGWPDKHPLLKEIWRAWMPPGDVNAAYYIPELDSVAKSLNVTRALVFSGYSDDEIEKILGLNYVRVMKKVLK